MRETGRPESFLIKFIGQKIKNAVPEDGIFLLFGNGLILKDTHPLHLIQVLVFSGIVREFNTAAQGAHENKGYRQDEFFLKS
jgi:hypothetical protein